MSNGELDILSDTQLESGQDDAESSKELPKDELTSNTDFSDRSTNNDDVFTGFTSVHPLNLIPPSLRSAIDGPKDGVQMYEVNREMSFSQGQTMYRVAKVEPWEIPTESVLSQMPGPSDVPALRMPEVDDDLSQPNELARSSRNSVESLLRSHGDEDNNEVTVTCDNVSPADDTSVYTAEPEIDGNAEEGPTKDPEPDAAKSFSQSSALTDSDKEEKVRKCCSRLWLFLLVGNFILLGGVGFMTFWIATAPWSPQKTSGAVMSVHGSPYTKYTIRDPDIRELLYNPKLRQSFYGIDYSPFHSSGPGCNITQKDVSMDMAVLSQLTKRVRLYETDCYQVDFVMNAIKDLDLDMTVSIGVWVDNVISRSLDQVKDLRRIIRNFPSRLIDSVLVGHEVLFREELTVKELIENIKWVKSILAEENMSHVPVGTSEIGSRWTSDLARHVEIVAANIHPFFGGVHVSNSTVWTYDFLVREVVEKMGSANVSYVISEVGWPTEGGALQGAVAGMDEMQTFLDNWLCTNGESDVGWYWFEAFDQPWKSKWNTDDAKWEPHWGLLTADRRLKDITIPQC